MDIPQELTGENSSKRGRLTADTGDAERGEDIRARLRKEETKNQTLEVQIKHLKERLDECEHKLKVMCTYSAKTDVYKVTVDE